VGSASSERIRHRIGHVGKSRAPHSSIPILQSCTRVNIPLACYPICWLNNLMSESSDNQKIDEVDFWPGHPISYTTTQIVLRVGDTDIGSGTGFVLQYARQYALITNWHVLSGRSPIDRKCLSKTGAIPMRAAFHVALVKTEKLDDGRTSELIHFRPVDIELYENGELDKPVWFDDVTEDSVLDVAAIPLANYLPELEDKSYSLRCIDGGKVTLKRGVKPTSKIKSEDVAHYYPNVGRQVFIVGYPAGIEHNGIFPIWKNGSIASEPIASVRLSGRTTTDAFYVDGLTRSGMSGSPVICLTEKGEKLLTADGVQVIMSKDEPYLLGVYAGREGVTQSESDLALGRVWKVEGLERLLSRIYASPK